MIESLVKPVSNLIGKFVKDKDASGLLLPSKFPSAI